MVLSFLARCSIHVYERNLCMKVIMTLLAYEIDCASRELLFVLPETMSLSKSFLFWRFRANMTGDMPSTPVVVNSLRLVHRYKSLRFSSN